jgi:hypothetical protein
MVTQILFTVSSADGNRAKRKRHRVRTNLAAVAGRKLKKDVASTSQNPDPKYGDHLSDDSIGMFSLLKCNKKYLIMLALSTRLEWFESFRVE